MMLTTQQQNTLKTFIQADPTLNAFAPGADNAWAIADLLAVNANPAFQVWQSNTPASDIYDAVQWAAFTPSDAPDGTTLWANRSLACQGKQFNLQTLLSGRETISTGKANIRAGLQDALTGIPSGTNGAQSVGGWPAVKLAIQRPANVLEKLFATGTGTSVNPATLVVEGRLYYQDIMQVMGW